MPFIGNTPDVNFTSFAKQDLTGVLVVLLKEDIP